MPTGGALTVNTVAASGGGSQSYDGDGTFTIGIRTDYTDAHVRHRNLDADSGARSRSPPTPARPTAPRPRSSAPRPRAGLATGCYRYVLTGTDNVGNTTTITTVVKVDTSAPAAPGLTLADSSADVHTTGTTAFYRPAGTGSFDVTASSTDGRVRDPRLHLPGTCRLHRLRCRRNPHLHPGDADRAQRRQARHRPQPGPPHLDGHQLHAHLRRGRPHRRRADGNSVAASGGGSQSYDNDGTFTIGIRTDYTDALSGLASSTLTREQGTLNADACSAYGAPTTLVGTPAQAGLATGCCRYVLTGTDNVGNATTITTVVKVDTTDPTAPALVARRLERRRPHHRHDRLLPPRRHRLLRRHCLLH